MVAKPENSLNVHPQGSDGICILWNILQLFKNEIDMDIYRFEKISETYW